jgi:hypothetical protein
MPTPILRALPEDVVQPALTRLPIVVLADLAAPCRAVVDLYANASLRWLCRRGAVALPGHPLFVVIPS